MASQSATSAVQKLYKVCPDGGCEVLGGWRDDVTWHNPLLAAYRFTPGEGFRIETTGGGGWGNPQARPAEKVLEDVLDDYVSIEAAREFYGVVINADTLKVNSPETEVLRKALAAQ